MNRTRSIPSVASERMRAVREGRRMTQEDLGELIGLTQAQVSNIEGGTTKVIGLDTLRKWLKAIGADANHVFGIKTEKGGDNGKGN